MAAKEKSREDVRQERLAALRDKLAKMNIGGNGGNAGWFKPEEGTNIIRILPPVHDMTFFFLEVGRHWLNEKDVVYCPKVTSDGELDCPICEMSDTLYRAGDKASRELGKKLFVRKKWWINVIDRSKEDEGPKIFACGATVFQSIANLINDPDYGDIFNEYAGLDITIEKEKTGSQAFDVKYNVIPRRKESPLASVLDTKGRPTEAADNDLITEWLEKAANLTWVELTEDPEEDKETAGNSEVLLLPYNRIVLEHNLDSLADGVEEEEEEEEDAPPPPKKSAVRQEVERRQARRR